VNWQHLRAFLWLRWRLRINQLRRGGIANVVILAILLVAAIAIAAVLFIVFLSVGLLSLKEASPSELMYVLDGLVVAFLFFWATGLLAELQRSEALSLEKFLHLPVSLTSAFLINYLSSLASVTLLWFLSALLGLSLGLLASHGLAMLWLWPMLAAFVLMVTALTYQFQGWLAALMANPRRRRTIIVVATMVFVLFAQVPNLVNVLHWQAQSGQDNSLVQEELQKQQELIHQLNTRKITVQELQKRMEEIKKEYAARREKTKGERLQGMEQTIRLMNLVLPPGWLPAGLEAIAEGRWWPVALAILGPALIGSASLRRAYCTTMRLYTGQYTSGPIAAASSRSVSEGCLPPSLTLRDGGAARAILLERKLPWLSEQATVVTLAVFRSLLRAPEAKMLLLSPIFLLVIFGSMCAAGSRNAPEMFRPLIGFGAMVMVLFSMSGVLGNQFGFDRDGFRVFVLSPARRRDILLGKNLAIAPLALTLGGVAAVFVQLLYPMRLDHFLALAPRFVTMYLLYCLVANILSILAPMRIASGSFQPAKPRGLVILLQLIFMFLCPVILSLTLLPFLIELAAEAIGWRYGLPLDLLLSLLECVAIVYIYGLLLGLQGDWLQAREQRILQIVTTRAE
jgi:ABC-2 type transport system permease protein